MSVNHDLWRSKWPKGRMIKDVTQMKVALGERWSDVAAGAIVGRKGDILSALRLAFAAGKNANCDFIEWLDREAVASYIYLSNQPINKEDAQCQSL